MSILNLTYKTTILLKYNEDCNVLGITHDLKLYIEESYSPDAWIAQHSYQIDGTHLATVDEDFGKNTSPSPLTIPPDLIRPKPGWHCMSLNFTGPRHRGLRGPERIVETVRSLSIQSKMELIERFNMQIPPPMILGLAESYVISEIELKRPNLYFVCRRIRIAYSLQERQTDDDGEFYDYDTKVIYLAHLYDKNRSYDAPIEAYFDVLPHVELNRPMDCLLCDNYLIIADGGNGILPSRIHIWEIDLSAFNDDNDDDESYI